MGAGVKEMPFPYIGLGKVFNFGEHFCCQAYFTVVNFLLLLVDTERDLSLMSSL